MTKHLGDISQLLVIQAMLIPYKNAFYAIADVIKRLEEEK